MLANSSTVAVRRARPVAGRVRPRALALFPVLGALLVALLLLNAGTGAVEVGPAQVFAIIAGHLGIPTGIGYTEQQDAVIWAIRLPRILLAALAGAGLGLAGAVLQGVFRNPLADPGLIGVSSGAALGAVVAVLTGFSLLGVYSLPLVAFAGGMSAVVFIYGLARHEGRIEVVTLILTGIAVNAVAGAGIGLGNFLADDRQLRTIVFWSMGSFGGASWSAVGAVLPCIGLGLLVLPFYGRALNLLALGEREARHLGLATERTRAVLVALCALMTGAAVAMAGIIGFVGLVAPHIIRLIAGPDHRVLLPASALGGAALLLGADLIARTVVTPQELPLGVVTSLVGGPFFLWLVMRTRTGRGGWG